MLHTCVVKNKKITKHAFSFRAQTGTTNTTGDDDGNEVENKVQE